MFEGQPQVELEALMKANTEFRQLYHRHKELDKQVLDAELGVLPVDDTTLAQMKREKLAAKDRLTRMYDRLHHSAIRPRRGRTAPGRRLAWAAPAFLVGRRRPCTPSPLPRIIGSIGAFPRAAQERTRWSTSPSSSWSATRRS